MIGWLKWLERAPRADAGALGGAAVVQPVRDGIVPAGCIGLLLRACGAARRLEPQQLVRPAADEEAWLFHPGPYGFDVAPFDAAPELGLRLEVAVDAPDPQLRQQRFDLFIASEARAGLSAEALRSVLETAISTALDQGVLALPPCATLDEWNAFRVGLNQLVYMRFGLVVDDCFPVDLGDQVDFAALLAQRAAPAPLQPAVAAGAGDTAVGGGNAPSGAPATAPAVLTNKDDATFTIGIPAAALPADGVPLPSGAPAGTPAAPRAVASARKVFGPLGRLGNAVANLRAHAGVVQVPASDLDAHALRRLFLELSGVMCAVRRAPLPPGPEAFHDRRLLLARLDQLTLSVATMPTFELRAPGAMLEPANQLRRAQASARAVEALDEAWSWLARAELPGAMDAAAADTLARLVANLDEALADRRSTHALEESA